MQEQPELGLPRQGNRFKAAIGRAVLRVLRWRVEGEFPNRAKMIVAVAPHKSNIDFVLAIAVIWQLQLRASYLAKHTLFKPPLGPLMVALGGIPVNRSSSQGLVEQMAAQFASRSQLVLGITPEGTRSEVREWKRGFALIAQAADVPVLPVILHTSARLIRFEPLITDLSDPDQVVATVKAMADAAEQSSGVR